MKGRMKQKCDVCGERDAVIFVKVFVEGSFEERALCPKCAIEYLENKNTDKQLGFVDQRLLDVIEEMRDLISGIITNISAITDIMGNNEENKFKCPNCGLDFEKFREDGMLGCPDCYETFREYIDEFLFEVERDSSHKGKMPKKFGEFYLLKKELRYLKNQLKKSIYDENYEKAEKIKRKIGLLAGEKETWRPDEFH